MPLLETCTDHVRGEAFFTITAAETWSIAMVKRLKAKYPEEVEIRITNPDGSIRVNKTPKVTGKGQQYFIEKFLKKKPA